MNTIEHLEQVNNDIRDAEWNRDEVKYLRRILPRNLLFRRASSAIVGKEDYLTALGDIKNTYSHLEIISIDSTTNKDENSAIIEDKAISIVILKAAGTRNDDKSFSGTYKNIRFSVRTLNGSCTCGIMKKLNRNGIIIIINLRAQFLNVTIYE